MAARPFRLIERAAPMPVRLLSFQKSTAQTRLGYPVFQVGQYRRILMQQIAPCLILDGWIAFQKPRDDFLPVHFHRPFLFQPTSAVSVRSTSLILSTELIHSGCCSVAYIFEDCCRPRVSENRYASCSQVSKTSVRSASSAMMTWCVHLPGYGSTASTI